MPVRRAEPPEHPLCRTEFAFPGGLAAFVHGRTPQQADHGAARRLFGHIRVFGAWLAGRAVRLAVHRYLDKTERAGADPTGIRFLGKLANLGVYICAFLVYSHIVPALKDLGSASLASMGVLSVVLGLAAQSTLGNLISGISLVLYRPFKLGDQLQVPVPTGTETGVVESINLGYTVLRAVMSAVWSFPTAPWPARPASIFPWLERALLVT